MTPDAFRRLALALPGAVEGSHMGHPDFRVGGRIFATLHADGLNGMVKLTPEQQARCLENDGELFRPASGAWGASGSTLVTLRPARVAQVRPALQTAWKNLAPPAIGAPTPRRRARGRHAPAGASTPADVQRIALALPGAEEGPCYGTPGFRVQDRLFARLLEDGDTLVLRIDCDSREALLEANPAAFFLTDHYRPYQWVLVRLSAVSPLELEGLVRDAWARRAPRGSARRGGPSKPRRV